MLIDNPIWFREQQAARGRLQRHPLAQRLRPYTLLLVWLTFGLVVSCLSFVSRGRSGFSWEDITSITLICGFFIQIVYVTMRSLVAGAAAFARERELQTMDTLLTSPLPLRSLVLGKWLSAAWPVILEVLVVVPLIAALGQTFPAADRVGLVAVGNYTLLNLTLVAFGTSVGLFMSSRAQNTSKAALRSSLMGLALLLGTYLADTLLDWATNLDMPAICIANPLWAAFSILFPCIEHDFHSATDPTYWIGAVIIYTVVACGLACLTIQRLRQAARES